MAKTSATPGSGQRKKKVYVVYDARASYDVDEASVLVACDGLTEAREAKRQFGGECVIYSYELVDGVATNGMMVI